MASEGFEPPKAEPADLQLSDAISKKSLFTNVPQYLIGQATPSPCAHFRPFPSIERNLNGGNLAIVEGLQAKIEPYREGFTRFSITWQTI